MYEWYFSSTRRENNIIDIFQSIRNIPFIDNAMFCYIIDNDWANVQKLFAEAANCGVGFHTAFQ